MTPVGTKIFALIKEFLLLCPLNLEDSLREVSLYSNHNHTEHKILGHKNLTTLTCLELSSLGEALEVSLEKTLLEEDW